MSRGIDSTLHFGPNNFPKCSEFSALDLELKRRKGTQTSVVKINIHKVNIFHFSTFWTFKLISYQLSASFHYCFDCS